MTRLSADDLVACLRVWKVVIAAASGCGRVRRLRHPRPWAVRRSRIRLGAARPARFGCGDPGSSARFAMPNEISLVWMNAGPGFHNCWQTAWMGLGLPPGHGEESVRVAVVP